MLSTGEACPSPERFRSPRGIADALQCVEKKSQSFRHDSFLFHNSPVKEVAPVASSHRSQPFLWRFDSAAEAAASHPGAVRDVESRASDVTTLPVSERTWSLQPTVRGTPLLGRSPFQGHAPLEEPGENEVFLRHRYQLFEAPEPGWPRLIYGIDKKRKTKIMAYHVVDSEQFHRAEALLRALRSPYVANLVDAWQDERGEGWILVERGGVRLGQYLDEASSLSDTARSEVLASIATTLLFLYQNGYLANLQASSFMQCGEKWQLVDVFDSLVPVESAEVASQRDLFHIGHQSSVVQAVVDGAFSSLQLPSFSSLSLGLIAFELLLSSSLFPERTSQDVYDAIMEDALTPGALPAGISCFTPAEFSMLDTLRLLVNGHQGACSEADAAVRLAELLQDHIMPSFHKQRQYKGGTRMFAGRRHYFSRSTI